MALAGLCTAFARMTVVLTNGFSFDNYPLLGCGISTTFYTIKFFYARVWASCCILCLAIMPRKCYEVSAYIQS